MVLLNLRARRGFQSGQNWAIRRSTRASCRAREHLSRNARLHFRRQPTPSVTGVRSLARWYSDKLRPDEAHPSSSSTSPDLRSDSANANGKKVIKEQSTEETCAKMSDRGSTERDASTLKATSEDDMASEEETFFEARSVSEEDIDLDALLSTSSTDQRVVSRLHDDPEIRAMLGIMTTGTATARIMKLLAKMGAGGTGEGSKVAREIAKTLAKTTLGVGGSLAAIPVVLSALGFSSIGPVAGSLAASFQSAFGATSAFSFLQSAAMGGGAFTPLCLVVTIPVGLFLTRNLWLPVVKKAIDSIQGFMHNAVEAIKDWWWSLFG